MALIPSLVQDVLGSAADTAPETNNRDNMAYCYHFLGTIFHEVGEYDSADIYLHQALDIRQEIKQQPEIGQTMAALGKLYLTIGDTKKALA
ncbi:MAG: tetratricopeptide repeat protein, partial [Spongiibacter sp.]